VKSMTGTLPVPTMRFRKFAILLAVTFAPALGTAANPELLKQRGSAAASASSSVVGKARVNRNPAREQRDWPVFGGPAENNHYSPLVQINRTNVKQLTVAWSFDAHEEGGLQTSPIVADGILYGSLRLKRFLPWMPPRVSCCGNSTLA
jgi:glucose dehydrogenase